MSQLSAMLKWDVLVQARHHIFTANIVSTAFICGFVLLLPEAAMTVKLATLFVFSDPALIGLSFVGAIVLMEKSMRVHLAVGITPTPPWVYVFSKIVILALSGTLSGLAVALSAYGAQLNWSMMSFALLLSNVFAVLLGFLLVARAKSMNDLMLRLIYASLVMFLPLIAHFGMVPQHVGWVLFVIPSTAMLWLFDAAGDLALVPLWRVGLAVAYLAVCIAVTWNRALKAYRIALSDGR